jgi:hypothetical protein
MATNTLIIVNQTRLQKPLAKTKGAGENSGDFMPIFLPAISIAVCLFLLPVSWGQGTCSALVRADVEVDGGLYSLADLLDRSTCPALLQAAASIPLGRAPLAGSDRVMTGDQVREWLAKLATRSGQGSQYFQYAQLPQRVIVRRAEPRISGRASPLETRGHNLIAAKMAPPAKRQEKQLVHPGEAVTLLWDQGGIRLVVPAVCLDTGGAGEAVRARIVRGGRMVRAIVEGEGRLRVAS